MRARIFVGVGIWVAAVVSCFSPGDSGDDCKVNGGACVESTACGSAPLSFSCLAGVCCAPKDLLYTPPDGGVALEASTDGASQDAKGADTGPSPDVTSPPADAGHDAGHDAGAMADAHAMDAPPPADASHPDSASDASTPDAHEPDGSPADAARSDAAPKDASVDSPG